jgi:hypothetical protein
MTTMGKARAAVVAAVVGALLYTGCTSRAVATGDDGLPGVVGGADASAVEASASDGAKSGTGPASDARADGGLTPMGVPIEAEAERLQPRATSCGRTAEEPPRRSLEGECSAARPAGSKPSRARPSRERE